MTVQFYDEDAPNTVANFIKLAKSGFYDGVTFHRVIPDFVIQGGDPTGTGMGGPGYKIKCELTGDNQYHDRGVLSMAHAGRDTGGSQFFICHSRNNTSHLDRNHTCFGKVVENVEVIDDIRQGDKIVSIEVTEEQEVVVRGISPPYKYPDLENMNLRGLVSVSGKPGLYKLVGQNKSGFILETLDEQKTKIVVNMNTAKMASLEDITIFGESGDIRLSDVFEAIRNSKTIPDPKVTDGKALRDFFTEVAPDHDVDRVYSSDIKKIISWFNIIKDLPLFDEVAPDAADNAQVVPATEAAPKKPEPVVKEKGKANTKAVGKSAKRLSQKAKQPGSSPG